MFHIVEKDETLGLIAKKFGVTVAEFMAANPDITWPSRTG
jgi:LysM repeat protein